MMWAIVFVCIGTWHTYQMPPSTLYGHAFSICSWTTWMRRAQRMRCEGKISEESDQNDVIFYYYPDDASHAPFHSLCRLLCSLRWTQSARSFADGTHARKKIWNFAIEKWRIDSVVSTLNVERSHRILGFRLLSGFNKLFCFSSPQRLRCSLLVKIAHLSAWIELFPFTRSAMSTTIIHLNELNNFVGMLLH